jgi:isoleucyl-tRNA synthetase
MYRSLTGERSVHLSDWPAGASEATGGSEAGIVPADPALVTAMDQVRDVCSAASSLRKAKKLRVRLPLPKLTVAVDDSAQLKPFTGLIADELNVKTVELTDDIAAHGRFEITVNARAAGPRLGKAVQDAIADLGFRPDPAARSR